MARHHSFLNQSNKRIFLTLRWIIIISLSYLILFAKPFEVPSIYGTSLILFLFLSNLILTFLPPSYFDRARMYYLIVVVDTLLVSLGVYLAGAQENYFFYIYFLIIFLSAIGSSFRNLMFIVFFICVLYGAILFKFSWQGYPQEPSVFLRIPLLFIAAIFYGYLVEKARREREAAEQVKKDSALMARILDIYKSLSTTLELKEILITIVRKVAQEVNLSTCSIFSLDMESGAFECLSSEGESRDDIYRDLSMISGPLLETPKQENRNTSIINSLDDNLIQHFKVSPSSAFFPLHYSSERKQWFLLYTDKGELPLNDLEEKLCLIITSTSSRVIDNAFLFQKVKRLARRDEMTGLFNYRYFSQSLDMEVERSQRYDRSFTLLMIDMDNLKEINDKLGHMTGDDALRHIATTLKNGTRTSDIAARYGGDEFVVILPETRMEMAAIVAERLRKQIYKRIGEEPDGPVISVSIGSATFPGDASSSAELIEAADRALYRAKDNGKNSISTPIRTLAEDPRTGSLSPADASFMKYPP